ncbi:MAG: DHA2 family efflux MFS transporter permease subunit [Acidimicrobiia bacterium]|nr:DHA2 family efflux MFS transporter permease subunit [Acidimicrobiia bacterium]
MPAGLLAGRIDHNGSMPEAPKPTEGVDYSRKWHVMVATGLGIFLGTIDGSIVNVALPTISKDLGTTFATVQWVLIAYLLTLATLTLSIGRLGDMLGKKPIYTTGFGVFTVGSVLCGLAPSIGALIAARVLQAIGAAMIFALGMAIITQAFPPNERGKALGISGALVSVGIVIGPSVGGFIIDQWSWRWIFMVNLPIGLLGTAAAFRFVPAIPPPGRQRFDFKGAAVFLIALLSVMLGLSLAQSRGFGAVAVIGLLALGLAGTFVFIAIEHRVPQPMLDLRLFSNRLLTINLLTGWMTFFAISGMFILVPFYLENVLGASPRQVGLLIAPAPLLLGIAAPVSGSISDRVGPRRVLVVGLAVLVVAYSLVQILDDRSPLWAIMLVMGPAGLGMGIFQSPNNSAVMGAAPPDQLGVTSAMLSITRNTGQLTGISVLGAVWALRVAHHHGATIDAQTAPAVSQAAALRDVGVVNALLMAIALALSLWGLAAEKRSDVDQRAASRSAISSK